MLALGLLQIAAWAPPAKASTIYPVGVGTTSYVGPVVAGVSFVASNDIGQAAGFSDSTGDLILYSSDGVTSDLGKLGTSMSPIALDDSGQIMGAFALEGPLDGYDSFLYSDGVLSDLTFVSGNQFRAYAMNNSGQIVGQGERATQSVAGPYGDHYVEHAYIYSAGKMQDLGTLGGTTSSANAINNAGQVVGWATVAWGSQNAFLYSNGTMTNLGTLGGPSSVAYGINDLGQVVGSSITNFTQQDAFLYSGGVMIDLNSLLPANSGWQLEQANSINDSGQIVGYGLFDGQTEGFLLDTLNTNTSSTPEPATFALYGSGFAVLILMRKRVKIVLL